MKHNPRRRITAQRKPSAARRRRGAMLVLLGLLLVTFVAMTALSVDVAYMHLARTQLRAATDAAARAGGEALSRQQSLTDSRDAAVGMAAANVVAGQPLALSAGDVVFGHSAPQEDGSWQFTPQGTPINSLQVIGRRTSSSISGPVGLYFAKALGVDAFEPTQVATVVNLDRDICLVLDRSSSMKLGLASTAEAMSTSDARFTRAPYVPDSRWAAAAAAVDTFVDLLGQTRAAEKCAVVTFASSGTWANVANVESSLDRPLTFDAAAVKAAVHAHTSRVFNGGTNTGAGIDAAVAELVNPSRARPFARKTMVLLSDGFGTTGRDPVVAAQDAADDGITIHTISFGANFNQSQLIAIANATGGNHYHAPDAAALAEAFHQIGSTLSVVLTK